MYVQNRKVYKPFLCVCNMEMEKTEKDGRLDVPSKWKALTRTNITTSIDSNIWEIAKKNNISWTNALEFGIRFLIADKENGMGYIEYPESAMQEKLHKVIKHRNALLTENMGLREQVPEIVEDEEKVKKEIDQVFGEVKKDGK